MQKFRIFPRRILVAILALCAAETLPVINAAGQQLAVVDPAIKAKLDRSVQEFAAKKAAEAEAKLEASKLAAQNPSSQGKDSKSGEVEMDPSLLRTQDAPSAAQASTNQPQDTKADKKPAQQQPTPISQAEQTPTQEEFLPPPPPPPSYRQPREGEQTVKNDDDLQGPFYLVDESPLQVIKILESLTGQIAVPAPNLPDVKINFSTTGKLARSEAILAFKSLLAINAIAITPMGEKFFKAAPITGVNTQAPEFITGEASKLPPSQYFYSKLYELKYIEIETFKDTLNQFISPNGIATLAIFPRSNAFLLTDTLVNQQRVEMLVKKLDTPPEIREDIGFIQLKNVTAEDLKRRISTLSGEILKKYFDKTILESDDRTNQLIVVTQRGNLKYINEFIEKLDMDSDPLTKSEVYYIRHGEAKDVASVLNEIVKGQTSAVKAANKAAQNAANRTNTQNRIWNAQARARGNAAAANRPTNVQADPTGAGLQFSDYITIVSDERSNSIVAYGTPTDLQQIGDIIDKIDIVLAQVKIDVIITEVTLTDKQVSGLSTFGLDYSLLPDSTSNKKGWSGNTSTLSINDGSSATPAFNISADEYGFNAVFNVAEQNNLVKVLSAPSIVTTHNKEATINVSQKYPLITGSTSYSGTTVVPVTQSTIDWQDIGIVLEVTPLIGENGVVQMKIKQTVESIIDYTAIDANTQPIIGKREAESFVSAKTGDTIVLAGLQQVKESDAQGAVWLLSDIPLIGDFFKPEKESYERTELIIFIRPSIVSSASYSEVLTREKTRESAAGAEVERYFKTGKFHDKEMVKDAKGEVHKANRIKPTVLPDIFGGDEEEDSQSAVSQTSDEKPSQADSQKGTSTRRAKASGPR